MEFRARLTISLAGDPMRNPGEVVIGAEAMRMVAAGFAVPIREEASEAASNIEVATVTRKRK